MIFFFFMQACCVWTVCCVVVIEQVKLAQLDKLDEELEEAKKQKQFETEDAQILE